MGGAVVGYEGCLCVMYTFYTGGQVPYFIICGDLDLKHKVKFS